ncbi:Protein-S-isoprenylcysteine O-methyltransferase Ste14 [Saccharopolyspora shandongensis]|uniref:Protein-S-isoprenylcysteine O-methyltransferase Ste14 n=1 Tax=Saccharopolyspora shandongensis TaxID=418495 RepID=A0A1H3E0D5_9PSEU|nr:isoprenylcysteine carboxylmethyltransferase family protein [Saccharopolyspora shandongensis]SDX72155.1 Protein-S-isoprenylcysteine O-methyltransferase Ste14 [Saccharopolyspora shandongensis]
MPALALALYLAGITVTFGIRTWMHVRRTGDSGVRRPAAPFGSAPWWSSVLFGTALLLGVVAPALAIAGMSTSSTTLDQPGISAGGFLIAIIGFTGIVAAQTAMGSSWRIGVDDAERTRLVTTGVFGFVRNPIFTAMIAAFAGLTLMVPTWPQFLGLVALVTAVEIQVRAFEEPYLARTHGSDYAAYASRAGRFLPSIGRIKATGHTG